MRILLIVILSCMPFATQASTPNTPCYIYGDYVGTLPITQCKKMNGDVYK